MKYKIEDGVPPPRRTGRGGGARSKLGEAIDALEVGQSFLVPNEDEKRARAACSRRAQGTCRRFTVRREGKGFRVFRLPDTKRGQR